MSRKQGEKQENLEQSENKTEGILPRDHDFV